MSAAVTVEMLEERYIRLGAALKGAGSSTWGVIVALDEAVKQTKKGTR